jgi:hypothetical protein
MNDKPKIDWSKLQEYSKPVTKPPPIQFDNRNVLDLTIPKPKISKKKSLLSAISTRDLVIVSLVVNVVIMLVAIAIVFWPKPSPLQEAANALQEQNSFKKKLAESCKLQAIEYRHALDTSSNVYDPFLYRFKITFKNIGHDTLIAFPLELRAVRKGRPSADYATTIFCLVKGGCNPGETLTIIENVRCSELRGRDVMQAYKLENGAVIEASVNGSKWINASLGNDASMDDGPDPLLESLMKAKVP